MQEVSKARGHQPPPRHQRPLDKGSVACLGLDALARRRHWGAEVWCEGEQGPLHYIVSSTAPSPCTYPSACMYNDRLNDAHPTITAMPRPLTSPQKRHRHTSEGRQRQLVPTNSDVCGVGAPPAATRSPHSASGSRGAGSQPRPWAPSPEAAAGCPAWAAVSAWPQAPC